LKLNMGIFLSWCDRSIHWLLLTFEVVYSKASDVPTALEHQVRRRKII